MDKGLTIKTGQTRAQCYLRPLLTAIIEEKIDTPYLVSHHMPLEKAPEGYKLFRDEQDHTTKIVLKSGLS